MIMKKGCTLGEQLPLQKEMDGGKVEFQKAKKANLIILGKLHGGLWGNSYAYPLLLNAYCLLLTAYRLMLIAYCLPLSILDNFKLNRRGQVLLSRLNIVVLVSNNIVTETLIA